MSFSAVYMLAHSWHFLVDTYRQSFLYSLANMTTSTPNTFPHAYPHATTSLIQTQPFAGMDRNFLAESRYTCEGVIILDWSVYRLFSYRCMTEWSCKSTVQWSEPWATNQKDSILYNFWLPLRRYYIPLTTVFLLYFFTTMLTSVYFIII